MVKPRELSIPALALSLPYRPASWPSSAFFSVQLEFYVAITIFLRGKSVLLHGLTATPGQWETYFPPGWPYTGYSVSFNMLVHHD